MKLYTPLKKQLDDLGIEFELNGLFTNYDLVEDDFRWGRVFNPRLYASSKSKSGNSLLYNANLPVSLDIKHFAPLLVKEHPKNVTLPIVENPSSATIGFSTSKFGEVLVVSATDIPYSWWKWGREDDLNLGLIHKDGNLQRTYWKTSSGEKVETYDLTDGQRKLITDWREGKPEGLEDSIGVLLELWQGPNIGKQLEDT